MKSEAHVAAGQVDDRAESREIYIIYPKVPVE